MSWEQRYTSVKMPVNEDVCGESGKRQRLCIHTGIEDLGKHWSNISKYRLIKYLPANQFCFDP